MNVGAGASGGTDGFEGNPGRFRDSDLLVDLVLRKGIGGSKAHESTHGAEEVSRVNSAITGGGCAIEDSGPSADASGRHGLGMDSEKGGDQLTYELCSHVFF